MSNIPNSKLCDMVLVFFKMGGAFCSAFAVLHMCLFSHYFLTCFATENITLSVLISDSKNKTLVSAGAKFELGFFDPGYDQGAAHSRPSIRRYVGIWYYRISARTVWVANRDSPLNDFTGVLAIQDGNIYVLDGERKSYWSTELDVPTSARTAKLLNTGNLVLVDDMSGETLCESFKNPTDAFLPGMEMSEDLTLTSWNSPDDPRKGSFTFQKYQQDQYIIRKSTVPYWVSGKSGMFGYNIIPNQIVWMLSNVNRTSSTGGVYNVSAPVLLEYNYTRLVMTVSGTIELMDKNLKLWSVPQDKCSIDNACGNFGICNLENRLLCRCLPGFSPSSPDSWDSGDFSGGYVHKSSSCDKNATFLSLMKMKIKNLGTVDVIKGKNESDCKNDCLQDCNCLAYSYAATDIRRSDSKTKNDPSCWIWRQVLSDLQEQYPNTNSTLNVRVTVSDIVGGNGTGLPALAPTEGQIHTERRVSSLIIYATVTAIVIAAGLTCTIVLFICKRKKRVARLQEDERSQSLQLYGSETRAVRMIQSAQFSEDDKRSIEVPFFELGSIIAATNNFSDENKLGRGGFGPVYKGVFPGNRQIAIKILASFSGQGLDEFKNEIVLISRLQHRNLVRLAGYCVTKEEKMLLYEYMPNKSLDYFIFDRALSIQLNWDIRFSIIMGISRGLLYLHEDSRLKIIHRDLKLSNILLDEELNPKISDFGLARIFGSKQTEAITSKVVGTYGYMSPEYALEGFFSVKSDVFSLGVMILEIISGKRNTGFYNSDQALSLLGFAWKLWTEGLALDLMDRELLECCKIDEYMKCMQIGLLCVQEDPKDRPTMSSLVRMLGNEITSLPTPKQPAFVLARGIHSGIGSSSNNQKSNSSNKLTLSAFEGR